MKLLWLHQFYVILSWKCLPPVLIWREADAQLKVKFHALLFLLVSVLLCIRFLQSMLTFHNCDFKVDPSVREFHLKHSLFCTLKSDPPDGLEGQFLSTFTPRAQPITLYKPAPEKQKYLKKQSQRDLWMVRDLHIKVASSPSHGHDGPVCLSPICFCAAFMIDVHFLHEE